MRRLTLKRSSLAPLDGSPCSFLVSLPPVLPAISQRIYRFIIRSHLDDDMPNTIVMWKL